LAVALEWVIHRSLRPTHLRLTFQPAHWPYTLLLPKYLTWVIMHHGLSDERRQSRIPREEGVAEVRLVKSGEEEKVA